MAPKLMKMREPTREVKRIMVALVAAATSGSTFISSIKGPCVHEQSHRFPPAGPRPCLVKHAEHSSGWACSNGTGDDKTTAAPARPGKLLNCE